MSRAAKRASTAAAAVAAKKPFVYEDQILAVRCPFYPKTPPQDFAVTYPGVEITGKPWEKSFEIRVVDRDLALRFVGAGNWKLHDDRLVHPLLGKAPTEPIPYEDPSHDAWYKKGPTGFLPYYSPAVLAAAIKIAFVRPLYVAPPRVERPLPLTAPQIFQRKGSRENLEDTFACIVHKDKVIMGVFDGHGGPKVAYKLQELFYWHWRNRSPRLDVEKDFEDFFERVESHVVMEVGYDLTAAKPPTRKPSLEMGLCGAVAVLAVVDRTLGRAYVGWIGDAFAAVVRKAEGGAYVEKLTRDHHADPDETARIMLSGGFVASDRRAMGVFSPTRTCGNRLYRTFSPEFGAAIEPNMDYLEYNIDTTQDKVFFLASDGYNAVLRSDKCATAPADVFELENSLCRNEDDFGNADDRTVIALFT